LCRRYYGQDAGDYKKGCIVGLHEVLRRQGLLEGLWTLNRDEHLSPAQMEEIDRVYEAYPEHYGELSREIVIE
jgi:hypothetical protein